MAKKAKRKAAQKKTTRKKKPGRKPALSVDLINRIVERIQACFYLKHSIEFLGYTERSLYKWLQRGEEEIERMEKTGATTPRPRERLYVELVREVRKAQADSITRHALNIQKNAIGQAAQYRIDEEGNVALDGAGRPIIAQPALPPNWQASARYLEAIDHQRWGRKVRTELTVPEGGPSELRITVRPTRNVDKEPKD